MTQKQRPIHVIDLMLEDPRQQSLTPELKLRPIEIFRDPYDGATFIGGNHGA